MRTPTRDEIIARYGQQGLSEEAARAKADRYLANKAAQAALLLLEGRDPERATHAARLLLPYCIDTGNDAIDLLHGLLNGEFAPAGARERGAWFRALGGAVDEPLPWASATFYILGAESGDAECARRAGPAVERRRALEAASTLPIAISLRLLPDPELRLGRALLLHHPEAADEGVKWVKRAAELGTPQREGHWSLAPVHRAVGTPVPPLSRHEPGPAMAPGTPAPPVPGPRDPSPTAPAAESSPTAPWAAGAEGAPVVFALGDLVVTPREATWPARCVMCAQPLRPQDLRQRRLGWAPRWTFLFAFSPFIFAPIYLLNRQFCTLSVGLCDIHRTREARSRWKSIGALAFGLACWAGAAAAGDAPPLVFLGFVAFVVAAALHFGEARIRVVRIEGGHAWVRCGAPFRALLPPAPHWLRALPPSTPSTANPRVADSPAPSPVAPVEAPPTSTDSAPYASAPAVALEAPGSEVTVPSPPSPEGDIDRPVPSTPPCPSPAVTEPRMGMVAAPLPRRTGLPVWATVVLSVLAGGFVTLVVCTGLPVALGLAGLGAITVAESQGVIAPEGGTTPEDPLDAMPAPEPLRVASFTSGVRAPPKPSNARSCSQGAGRRAGTQLDRAVIDCLDAAVVVIEFSDGSSGAGFAITPTGMIVTAHHVVAAPSYSSPAAISVRLKDQSVFHEVGCVADDAERDLTVLQVSGTTPRYLKPPPAEAVTKTTPVIVVGHPVTTEGGSLDYWRTTIGIVNSVYPNRINTSAALDPGNSGGPAVRDDADLEVVGVVSGTGARATNMLASGTALREVLYNLELYPCTRIE